MRVAKLQSDQVDSFNSFLKNNDGSFLQTLAWKEFQERAGKQSELLVVTEGGAILLSALMIRHALPLRKKYFYIPRGPVLSRELSKDKINEVLRFFVKRLGELTQPRTLYFRFEPEMAGGNEKISWDSIVSAAGLKKTKAEVQPRETLILDIRGSEDEILKEMHQKTRYNIRLAKKRGVRVRQSNDPADVDTFYSLLEKTTEREKFKGHGTDYYKTQLKVLGAKDMASLFIGEIEENGKTIPVAANLLVFYNNQATYLHGASDYNYRQLMAPHLLQWAGITAAKKKGFAKYDFWGIASKGSQMEKAWSGITRFKLGFGGEKTEYVGGYDLVTSPTWYMIYNTAKKLIR